MRNNIYGLIALGLVACADKPYDPNGPAIDPNAPTIDITSPTRGTVAGDVQTVTVTGTASDDTGVASVSVNGVAATLAADGTWSATVPVTPGTNLLHAIALDAAGNAGKQTRAVVAGPMVPIGNQVTNGLTATLSAQTFAAIGKAAAGVVTNGDVASLIAEHNPVLDSGGGPDCLYIMGSITSMTVGGATVGLVPQTGGLALDVELSNLNIGMHLSYAAACISGSRDITIAASHIAVTGTLAVGVNANAFAIALNNSDVTISGLDVDLGGIPGAVVDLFDLNAVLAPVFGWAAEKFVVPALNTALNGLNNTKTITALGVMVDVALAPSKIDFSAAGAVIELDTSLRAHGDSGNVVFVPHSIPVMDVSQGFQLAVEDDAANQLLTSLQSAKALDQTFDLKNGSYGDVGTLYDSVEISAAVPPYVDATGDGLVLTVGDLMATFRNGNSVATEIAINAQVDLKVVTAMDGSLKFDVGTPTTYVDVLDQGVDGANQLSNANFEAIASFALGRVVAVGSGSVGAIPLPSVGGVSVENLAIGEQTGYLVVAGSVQ